MYEHISIWLRIVQSDRSLYRTSHDMIELPKQLQIVEL